RYRFMVTFRQSTAGNSRRRECKCRLAAKGNESRRTVSLGESASYVASRFVFGQRLRLSVVHIKRRWWFSASRAWRLMVCDTRRNLECGNGKRSGSQRNRWTDERDRRRLECGRREIVCAVVCA